MSNMFDNGFILIYYCRINNHSGNLRADALDRNPQAGCPRARRCTVEWSLQPKLRLWQAPSSKLWTGKTDMQTDNLNLTLYI